ncbi:MAG TPA: hypothetical protein VMY39_02085, partial [Planctomycetota bacterium]|nr:hypothetical protein [Planctomycetota bacterium]
YLSAADYPRGVTPPLVGRIRREAVFRTRFAMMLLPYRGRRTPTLRLEQVDLPHGMLLRVGRGDDTDVIWVRLGAGSTLTRTTDIETDARTCIIRLRGGRLRQAVLVDGTRLLVDGKRPPAARTERLTSTRP